MKNIFHRCGIASLLLSFSAAIFAFAYSFVTAIDFSSDQTADFSQTKALFKVLQGGGARFSPSDTLNFVYQDGTVATFGLEKGTAAACFINGKCIWDSTQPFTNAGSPTAVKNRPGRVTIMTPKGGDDRTAVVNSGWYDYSTIPTPTPIAFPNSNPIGQIWGNGIVTSGPLITTQVNGTPITPGATVTATNPSTGQTVTATVSADGQSITITTGTFGGVTSHAVDVVKESIVTFRDVPPVQFSTSPGTLSFSASANGYQTKSITVTNRDSLPTAVTTVISKISGSGSGAFSADAKTCGSSLAPGASCTVNVKYAAGCSLAGSNAATLFIGSTLVPISGGYSSGMCY